MKTRLAGCAIVLCLASLALVAGQARPTPTAPQQARLPPPRTTGLITGRVVDGATGKPVAGAVVSLDGGTALPMRPGTPPPQPNLPPPGMARSYMVTNGGGQFVFHGLTRGRYTLSASAAAYVDGTYGQRRPAGPSAPLILIDDQRLGNVVLTIWHHAAISGTVTDEAGEPVVNAVVRVLRRMTTGNRRRLVAGTQARTDDRGMYRLGRLLPGDFIVFVPSTQTTVPTSVAEAYQQTSVADNGAFRTLTTVLNASRAPMPTGQGVQFDAFRLEVNGINGPVLGAAPDGHDRVFVYPTVYYPAALTVGQATQLTVGPGEEKSNVDLQLRPLPTARVSGTVIGPEGPVPNLGLHLLPVGTDESLSDVPLDTATTLSDEHGAFTFLGVPQGRYSLRAQIVPPQNRRPPPPPPAGRGAASLPPQPAMPAQTLWAESPVAVTDSDIDGVALTLRPGAKVSGRLEFHGAAPPPAAAALQRITVALNFADPQGGAPPPQPARVEPDGSFTIQGAIPGRYLLPGFTAPAGWVLRDARIGGRDLDEAPLEVGAQDVAGLVVSFVPTSQQTQIGGTVRDGMTAVTDDSAVVAFPADYASWLDNGMSARRMRMARTSASGGYRIVGLPPGDYLIVALKQDDAVEWPDPEFVRTLARLATRLTVGEAEHKAEDLTTVRVR